MLYLGYCATVESIEQSCLNPMDCLSPPSPPPNAPKNYQSLHPSVRRLGLCDYLLTWEAMKTFTLARTAVTPDEIWLVEHPPVYTLGIAGKREHLLNPNTEIPLFKVDRGGQITYHGPGQLVAYLLLDVKRSGWGIRHLVEQMQIAVINLLSQLGLNAHSRKEAPGVYLGEAKIAALGLRIKNGCCYHGLSLNINMDLNPFLAINPCGYANLKVTQLADHGVNAPIDTIADQLLPHLLQSLL